MSVSVTSNVAVTLVTGPPRVAHYLAETTRIISQNPDRRARGTSKVRLPCIVEEVSALGRAMSGADRQMMDLHSSSEEATG